MKVIKKWQEFGFKILDNVQTTMKVKKVVDFVNVNKSFDQDEELNLNSKLFGSILVMDGVNIVAIICHKIIPLDKALTWVIKLYGCFEMVGMQKGQNARNLVAMFKWWWVHENVGFIGCSNFMEFFLLVVLHLITSWW